MCAQTQQQTLHMYIPLRFTGEQHFIIQETKKAARLLLHVCMCACLYMYVSGVMKCTEEHVFGTRGETITLSDTHVQNP